MTTYQISDANGYELCDGLQRHEASTVAQRKADERGESVWLSESGSEEMGTEYAPIDTPRITANDIYIGQWTAEDGSRYRAAYVSDCVLTGPEHASLPDSELLAEAESEAKRVDIWKAE